MPLFVMRKRYGEKVYYIEYGERPFPKLRDCDRATKISDEAARLGIVLLIAMALR